MTARRAAGAFLTFYGLAALLLCLSRCGAHPEAHAPPYWPADAGTPCDGGCPYDATTRQPGPSAAAVLEAILRAAAEVTAEAEAVADSAPNVAPMRSIECDDDGCRVVPVSVGEGGDGGRVLERLTRETKP